MANLVQIKSSRNNSKHAARSGGFVADKYFLVGVISSFLGTGYLGAHLWLMLNGTIKDTSNYQHFKILHACIQLYLFTGLFILGFMFQAAGKLFSTQLEAPKETVRLILLPLLGILVIALFGNNIWGRLLLVSPFFYLNYFIVLIFINSDPNVRYGQCLPAFTGSIIYILSAFLNPSIPQEALLIFWGACLAFIFSAGQQFISGVFGGSKMKAKAGLIFTSLYILSITCLAIIVLGASLSTNLWQVFLGLSTLCIVLFLKFTNFKNVLATLTKDPLALGMISAFTWAFVGIFSSWQGSFMADRLLHIWAIAWLFPIVILVSARIMNSFTSTMIFGKTTLFIMIIAWQLVPAARGLYYLKNSSLDLLGLLVACAVIACWLTGLLKGCYLTRKIALKLPSAS